MEARLQLRKAGTTSTVGYVSRFMEAPREEHLVAVKRILRYVAGTRGWGVRYCAGSEKEKLKLVGYSDSDMADDVDDRKSTSGMIYFLSGDAICWQSTKQKVVALSSCEAEYIALSMAATQRIWLARLMEELIGRESDPPMLYVDNKATISLIKNPVLHDRSKHIEIRFHYIRECADRGLIKIDFIRREEQLGDIFTKSLARVKFEELRSKIGVQIIRYSF